MISVHLCGASETVYTVLCAILYYMLVRVYIKKFIYEILAITISYYYPISKQNGTAFDSCELESSFFSNYIPYYNLKK